MKTSRFIRRHAHFFLTLLSLFAFRWSFADQYVIPTGSMEPTIQPGDHVFVNKMSYDLKIPFTERVLMQTGAPRRGDVVVFRDPRDPAIRLVKRLVGLPGDRIEVTDGVVRINGTALPLSAPRETRGAIHYTESLDHRSHWVQRLPQFARPRSQVFTVPANRYFFLGDNRDNSADSREWGFAPREALQGKALRVIYNVRWKGALPVIDPARIGGRMTL